MRSRFLRMGVLGLSVVCGLVVLAWEPFAAQLTDASTASLHVEVRDSHSRQPVAARCYLTDESRKSWTPAGAFAYERRLEKHFIIQGGFDISLPPGLYLLRVERGPEYQPLGITIDASGRQDSL